MEKNKAHKKHIFFYIVAGLALFLAALCNTFVKWGASKFGVTLKEILYTILSPMKGADADFLMDAVKTCLPVCLTVIVLWILYVVIDVKINKTLSIDCCIKFKEKQFTVNIPDIFRGVIVLFIISSLIATTAIAENTFKIVNFISSYTHQTTIYEDYYVDPNSVAIKSPKKQKNLIRIYLESMETTYASKGVGGYQQKNNYIPNLTNYAKENISFSNSENLGGFKSLTGTTWTIASLFATTSGVPFSFPVSANAMGKHNSFASGITTMGDILKEEGYYQEFLCGSDGDYAGRKDYLMQHGFDKVYDIFSAKKDKYIPEDYFVWWGYEDSYLYEIAKDEVTNLAKNNDQPFNFTMLTVDTHHIDGYVCDICPKTYNNQLENVISCADLQLYNFIEWCKQQPFYEDTVIVITGDHPRMDTTLVSGAEYLDRTVYNCFINTDKTKKELNLTNRDFTAMDIFPTVLSALNYEIEGDRLGLGTDMFSNRKTLAEELGVSNFEVEIGKYSKYYIDNFS